MWRTNLSRDESWSPKACRLVCKLALYRLHVWRFDSARVTLAAAERKKYLRPIISASTFAARAGDAGPDHMP